MIYRALLPTFQGVATNGTAFCNMVLGQKVHAITLRLGDDGTSSGTGVTGTVAAGGLTTVQIEKVLAALITDIRVRLNSKDQRVHTGVQLNQLNGLNGSKYLAVASGTPGTAGFRITLWLWFSEPWRKNNLEVASLAWNLNKKGGDPDTDGKSKGDVTSCEIQVDINGVTSPVIDGFYLWSEVNLSKGIGTICKYVRQDLPAIGAKNDFNLDMVQMIQSIHLWPTVETTPKYVSYFRLKASGKEVQERLDFQANQILLNAYELSPDTANNRFDFVADLEDPVLSLLPASAQSSLIMYLEYSGSAAGGVPMITLRVGAPD